MGHARAQAFVYITADFETAKHALNQAVVWSRIVESREKAAIAETLRMEYPYALTDPGAGRASLRSQSACQDRLDGLTLRALQTRSGIELLCGPAAICMPAIGRCKSACAMA